MSVVAGLGTETLVGANPDNMAPTNAIDGRDCENKVQVLSFGIDTLHVSLHGELSDNLLILSHTQ